MNKIYTILLALGLFFVAPAAFAGSAAPASADLQLSTAAPSVELDKKAERAQKKALRKHIREMRKNKKDDSEVLEIILAIIIPPLGVYLHQDEITIDFWVSLILMLLTITWVIASVFALLVVLDVFSLA